MRNNTITITTTCLLLCGCQATSLWSDPTLPADLDIQDMEVSLVAETIVTVAAELLPPAATTLALTVNGDTRARTAVNQALARSGYGIAIPPTDAPSAVTADIDIRVQRQTILLALQLDGVAATTTIQRGSPPVWTAPVTILSRGHR